MHSKTWRNQSCNKNNGENIVYEYGIFVRNYKSKKMQILTHEIRSLDLYCYTLKTKISNPIRHDRKVDTLKKKEKSKQQILNFCNVEIILNIN